MAKSSAASSEAPAGTGRVRLHVTAPDGRRRTVELTGTSFVLGTSPAAQLRLDDPRVSAEHAKVFLRGSVLYVAALDPAEDTLVDGAKVTDEARLQPGETLRLGDTEVQVAGPVAKFEKSAARGGEAERDQRFIDDKTIPALSMAALGLKPERLLETRDDRPKVRTGTPAAAAARRDGGGMQEARKIKGGLKRAGASVLDEVGWRRSAPVEALRDHAVRFLSDELPENMRPKKDDKQLIVALVWGKDEFLDIRDVDRGQTLFASTKEGPGLQIFHDVTAAGPVPLVQPEGDGFRVLLPAKTNSRVRTAGKDRTGDELVKAGEAQGIDVPFKGASYTLGLDDRVLVEFGSVELIARYTRPSKTQKRPFSERVDVGFATTLIILILCAIAAERMVAITDFGAVQLSDDLFKNKDRFAKYIAKAEQKDTQKFKDLSGVKEGAKAKDDEGKFGKKDAKQKDASPSKKGAPLVDVDKREEDRKKVMKSGLMALLGAGMGDAASNVFGPGGLGTGLNNALGGIKGGGPMGDAQGVGGLGARGGGSGGGGTALGIGGLGRSGSGRGAGGSGEFDLGGRGKDTTRFVPGKTTILGGLSQEVVGRIIRRHWNEIKYCYEKELAKDPNLYGKVAIYFEIGPVGDVATATIKETTMGNSEAENCMLAQVKRWKFPAPQGGGIVQVTYPFIFKSAD